MLLFYVTENIGNISIRKKNAVNIFSAKNTSFINILLIRNFLHFVWENFHSKIKKTDFFFIAVILSTWRSGSTFLGDIMNAMPGNYYHYEPLLYYDIVQIRGPPESTEALNTLRQLLKCNYTGLGNYLEYGQGHHFLFTHNTRLWRNCHLYPQFCFEPNFLNPFCRLFPFQSMKVVRLRAELAEPLLIDPSLNVKIVLLVRDPRGTIQSRKHRDWCPGQPDCWQPAILCNDMVSDFKAAEILTKKYPLRFKAIRYEDLSLDVFKVTKEILSFYGLPFDAAVEEFLDSHTRTDIGGVSSTFRDSKTAPFHWMRDLSFHEIDQIQEHCKEAMEKWGYRVADNDDALTGTIFNPLLKFPFSSANVADTAAAVAAVVGTRN